MSREPTDLPVVTGRNGRPRSPKSVRRAIEQYGRDPTSLTVMMYAKLLSEGKSQRQAFLACFPHAADWKIASVDKQASLLAAHPKVAGLIAAHTLGARNLAAAAVPEALRVQVEVMRGAHGANPKQRIDAANSIADRGGLPRGSEVRMTSMTMAVNMLGRIPDAPSPGAPPAPGAVEIPQRPPPGESDKERRAWEERTQRLLAPTQPSAAPDETE